MRVDERMRNEIFISYSHRDKKYLEELRRVFLPYERELRVSVWDDRRIEPGSAWKSEVEEALERARVAVLIVSAHFLASSFIAEAELPPILRAAERGGLKILWIAVSECAYEATEIALYQAANEISKPLDQMRPSKRMDAWSDIARKIVASWKAPGTHRPAQELNGDDRNTDDRRMDGRRTILLAQVTDDVQDEADQLRNYLEQYSDEIAVLPTSGYPQGGEPFRASFERDLAQAGLFVQLLGPRPGRTPPDLPEGYTRWQLERTKAAGARVEVMQWRHPQLDTNAVSNGEYREIVTGDTVVACGLESFKRQVLGWARKPSPKLRKLAQSTVFINADERDLSVAREIERECLTNALAAILPMTGSSAAAIRRDLEANLLECDVLVFIYGDTTPEWMREQLRFFNRVCRKRELPLKVLVICNGPPAKPEIGMKFPEANVIECPQGWDLTALRRLLAEANL